MSYVKNPLRPNASIKIKKDDKNCFIWSVLASILPCDNDHPNRVSNYRQYFDELNIDCFDFSNRFKCSDVHRFEKLNNLSINLFEITFCQVTIKCKHNLIPNEIS